jgi:hypothetical protein
MRPMEQNNKKDPSLGYKKGKHFTQVYDVIKVAIVQKMI